MRQTMRRRFVSGSVCVVAALGAALLAPAASGDAQTVDETVGRPLSLSASPVPDGVMLSWDAPASGAETVTGYEILRRRPRQGESQLSTLVEDTGSTETEYLDTTATVAGERYVYRVKALTAAGPGPQSRYARIDYAAPEPARLPASVDGQSGAVGEGSPQPEAPTTTGPVKREVAAAVLTVGVRGGSPVAAGYSSWGSLGELSGGSFSIDGVGYVVQVLAYHAGGLYLGVSRPLPEDFVLGVGDQVLASVDSFKSNMRSKGRYWWPVAPVGWSEGDQVAVSVTLEGSGPVAGRPKAPPMAEFMKLSGRHDGAGEFGLRLYFFDDFGDMAVDAALLKDHALDVSGASVSAVEALSAGTANVFTISLQPDGPGAVTVAVAATADCSDPGAVCTTDGRKLRNHARVVIAGPPDDTSPRLRSLQLDGVVPSGFNPDRAHYRSEVPAGTTETTVSTRQEPGAVVEILTLRSDSAKLALDTSDADLATPGHQTRLAATGETLILIRVTSPDGQHQAVYVVVIEAPQADQADPADQLTELARSVASKSRVARADTVTPTLNGLTLTGATLSPTFAAATTTYTAAAAATTGEVTIAATTADTNAAVLIAPADADTATAGHQVALAEPLAGGTATSTPIAVIVRSSDGTKLNAYVVTVTRAAAAGDDATLSALTVGGVTLIPAFDADTYSYTASVAATVARVVVAATTADTAATAAITPADADSDTTDHEIDLDAGDNTVTVTVTAEDGTTTRTYVIDLLRGTSNDSRLSSLTLSGLTLSPAFDPDTLAYTAVAPTSTTRTTVAATARHSGATVAIAPRDANYYAEGHQVDLHDGPTRIVAAVTAEDGTTTGYAIYVGRPAAASDATLGALSLQGARLKPVFVGTHYAYEAVAGSARSQVTVWAAPTNIAAGIEIVPADAAPDAAGHQVDLAPIVADGQPSQTIVAITVTSTDTTAAETYAIEITRRGELPVQDPDVTLQLPEGCSLLPLYATDDGLQPPRRWVKGCRSVLTYIGRPDGGGPLEAGVTGYARFYKMEVLSDDEVTVRMDYTSTSGTANYLVLRSSDGTVLAQRHHVLDSACYNPCDETPIVMDLDAGVYVIETVQHFSYDGRQWWNRIVVEGDVMLDARLASISVDSTPIEGFERSKRSYRLERTAATVTLSAAFDSTTTPAGEITFFPADADLVADGHQVALAEAGITTAWVTAAGPSGLKPKSYRLQFYGSAPAGTPLTAEFADLPEEHDGRRFSFSIVFSEPIRNTESFSTNPSLEIGGASVHRVQRLESNRWKITVTRPVSATQDVTIKLKAPTSCVPKGALCSFYGKPLSADVEATVSA